MTTKFYVDADGAYLGGFDGAQPPQDAVEVPAAPADARQIWNGNAWGAIPAPPVPSTPTLIATAIISIEDGVVSSMSVSAKLAGVFQFGTGEYWAFFAEPQPDTDYMVLAYDSGTHRVGVAVIDKATDYFIIRATDFDGVPGDPSCVNVEVKRVI